MTCADSGRRRRDLSVIKTTTRITLYDFPEKSLYLPYVSITGANNFKTTNLCVSGAAAGAGHDPAPRLPLGLTPGVACLAAHCRA
jgi:hypothetical protein